MVICLERDADVHMAQLMPLSLTVSCSCEFQIGFTFLVLADLGSPGQRAVKRVCVCVSMYVCACICSELFAKVRDDTDQLRAAELIACHPVVVLSGKGGCGKTEVVSAVISYAISEINSEKYASSCSFIS